MDGWRGAEPNPTEGTNGNGVCKRGWGKEKGGGARRKGAGSGERGPKYGVGGGGFWLTHKGPIREVTEGPIARTAGGQAFAGGN